MRIALASGVILLTLFVLIWSLQRKLMYFPSAMVPDPRTLGLHNVQEIHVSYIRWTDPQRLVHQ